jgi:hypothetical protein
MLGSPGEEEWSEGFNLAKEAKIIIPKFEAVGFPRKILAGSPGLVDLLSWMLQFNPAL